MHSYDPSCSGCVRLNDNAYKKKLNSLYWVMVSAAVLDFSTGLFMALFYNENATTFLTHSYSREITGDRGEQRTCLGSVSTRIVTMTRSFETGPLMAAFPILDFLQYWVQLMIWQRFTFDIAHHRNPIQWLQYAVSSPLMSLLIAFLCSITDVTILAIIVMSQAWCILHGWLSEVYNPVARTNSEPSLLSQGSVTVVSDKPVMLNTSYFWLGTHPFVVKWAIIIAQFIYAMKEIPESPPDWLVSLIFLLFFIESQFGVVQYLWLIQWRLFKEYINSVFGYVVLSLVAKQFLVWQVYGGQMNLDCQ